jgi:RNA polymerase sigma factor (sigma-70 family)
VAPVRAYRGPVSVRRQVSVTRETFEDLLSWLHPEPDVAGHKYETIRSGLVRLFVSRGFGDAEDLADLTINRVAARLPEIRENYVGEPARYFYGVARNVVLETSRRKEVATDRLPERTPPSAEASDEYECLLRCLRFLPPDKREMILDYHAYTGKDKIVTHRAMAEELCITESALRLQAYRARMHLQKCVLECVENLGKKRKSSGKTF